MSNTSTQQVINVTGMTCGHCAASIRAAVNRVDGVTSVDVRLADGTVIVEGVAATSDIANAITEAGYEVEGQ
ncbi:MAG: cation transporter [Solirubrobacterales bacterium]